MAKIYARTTVNYNQTSLTCKSAVHTTDRRYCKKYFLRLKEPKNGCIGNNILL